MPPLTNGSYLYYNDGQLSDVRETWSIKTTPDGQTITYSERRAPSFGSHIEVEAVHDQQGRITAFTVAWHNTLPPAVAEATARYTIGAQIDAEWIVEGSVQRQQQPAPANLVVMPLMRVFTAGVIQQIVQYGGEAEVLIPNITDPANQDRLLSPLLEKRQAHSLGEEMIEGEACNLYQYTGGNYDASARFWINQAQLLARYTFQNWDVRLAAP